MKKITTLIIIAFISTFGYGQTSLSAGDIAITGFNSDGQDEFTFVLLTDITSGTEINFTDNGWVTTATMANSANSFRSNEGTITWTATTDLPCGTEINIIDNSPFFTSPATGTVTDSGLFQLSTNGDQILAYQGPDASPVFIYAIDFNSTPFSNATTSSNTGLPLGLTNTVNAINFGETDNGNYGCAVINGRLDILAAVSTVGNWTTTNTRIPTLGGCGFNCSACTSIITWDGTTWSNGTGPNLTIGAIIDGNYDTATFGAFSACSLIINTGNTLDVNNSTFVEIGEDVTVNGTLTVQTRGNFVQNDDISSFTNNGISQVLKSTPVKLDWFFYTYWSSPVSGLTVDDIFPVPPGDTMFRFGWNAANYQDIIINADGSPGADGIDDDNNAFIALNGTDPLTPGIGYAITEAQGLFFGPTAFQRTYSGTFNNGPIDIPVFNDPATVDPTNNGAHYHFLGNPYPSALDFNVFQAANTGTIGPLVYYWSQATPPDAGNAGNQGVNFSQNDYAIYMVSMGTGTAGASGVIPNEFVPSGQGFFVPSIGAGTATFNNSMRANATTLGSNDIFFGIEENKVNLTNNASSETNSDNLSNRNLIWLNLTSNNGIFNQALVGYINGATDANDGITYEATRILPFEPTGIIYTFVDGENTKLAIQGKDPNGLDETEIISLGFDTDIDPSENTTYTLSIAQFEGAFFDTAPVFLVDNLLGVSHNLSDNDYSFSSEVGEFQDRFEIRFEDITLSTDEFEIAENNLAIVELDNGEVQFRISNNFEMENIKIIDLTGRELYNLEASGSENTYNLSGLNRASVYIAQVELTNGSVITKKAIKRN